MQLMKLTSVNGTRWIFTSCVPSYCDVALYPMVPLYLYFSYPSLSATWYHDVFIIPYVIIILAQISSTSFDISMKVLHFSPYDSDLLLRVFYLNVRMHNLKLKIASITSHVATIYQFFSTLIFMNTFHEYFWYIFRLYVECTWLMQGSNFNMFQIPWPP